MYKSSAAQNDVNNIGKTIEFLIIEFGQVKLDETRAQASERNITRGASFSELISAEGVSSSECSFVQAIFQAASASLKVAAFRIL